jgi:hypothetical protein
VTVVIPVPLIVLLVPELPEFPYDEALAPVPPLPTTIVIGMPFEILMVEV